MRNMARQTGAASALVQASSLASLQAFWALIRPPLD